MKITLIIIILITTCATLLVWDVNNNFNSSEYIILDRNIRIVQGPHEMGKEMYEKSYYNIRFNVNGKNITKEFDSINLKKSKINYYTRFPWLAWFGEPYPLIYFLVTDIILILLFIILLLRDRIVY